MAEQRNILCENIARYRKSVGLTQEELGKRVGVSTQAVSKWECGGMPDIVLLPTIADTLGTSIDALFGRDAGEHKPLESLLEADIANTPEEKQLWRIYHLCWAMMQSTICYRDGCGGSVSEFVRSLGFAEAAKAGYIPFRQSDEGLQLFSLSKSAPFFMLLPEPKDGYASMLYDAESYEKLFSLLARPNRFRSLAQMEMIRRSCTPGYLGNKLGISPEAAAESLEDLHRYGLCYEAEVDTENGVQRLYTCRSTVNVTPLLLSAGLLMHDPGAYLQFIVRREPMLTMPLGEENPSAHWEPERANGFCVEWN